MKKILSLILATAISFSIGSFSLNVGAASDSIAYDFAEYGTGDWDANAVNAEIRKENGALVMDADTSGASANAVSEVASPILTAKSDGTVNILFEFCVDSTDANGLIKCLYMVWSGDGVTASSKTRLIWMHNNTIYVASSKVGYTPEEFYDKKHIIQAEIDLASKKVTVEFDGTAIGENVSFTANNLDSQNLQFMFANSYNNKATTSVMRIYNFYATSLDEVHIVSNPADGAELVDVTALNRLTVNFGTFLQSAPDIRLYVADSTGESYEEAEAEFKMKGFTAAAELTTPLESFKKYKISVVGIVSNNGTQVDDTDIIFTTAPAEYSAPEIAIKSPVDGSEYREGREVILSADAVSKSEDITSVEFYAGDRLVAVVSKAPYRCTWTADASSAEWDITAIAYDSAGGSAKSSAIKIAVIPVVPPTVSVKTDIEGKTFRPDEVPQIELETEASGSTIAYTELYLDGKLLGRLSNAPYIYDLGDCSLGYHTIRAVAYDVDGVKGETQSGFYVLQSSVTTLDNVYCIYNTKGGVKTRENFGTICKGENLTLEFTAMNGILTAEADVSIDNPAVKASFMVRGIAADGSTKIDMHSVANFDSGTITVRGEEVGRYECGKQYHMVFAVDVETKKFTFVFTDKSSEETVVNVETDLPNPNFVSVAVVRITCTEAQGIDDGIVCENISATLTGDYPYVLSVTDEYGNTPVSYTAKEFVCTLSTEIGEITKDNIRLENELGSVEIASAVKSAANVIVITPACPAESACTYTVTLDKNTPLIGGQLSGMEITGRFTTAPRDFDVISGSFAGEDEISFSADIINTFGAKSVTVVLVTYENGIVASITSKTAVVSGDKMTVTTPKVPKPEVNPSAEGFVIDSWKSMIPVSAKQYWYEFAG